MPETFELKPYLSFPVRTPAGYLALSRSLITASNARPVEALKGRVELVHARAVDLQVHLGAASVRPPSTTRQGNRDLDRIWGVVAERLDHRIELAPEDAAGAARAKELKAWLLGGDGLAWLRQRYREQWSQSEAKLGALDASDAEANRIALGELVGDEFLAALRARHAAFGAALGITEPAPQAEAPPVREAMDELRATLLNYVQGIGGLVDFGAPETIAHAKALLAPIDAFRAAAEQPRPDESAEPDETAEPPEQPIPNPS